MCGWHFWHNWSIWRVHRREVEVADLPRLDGKPAAYTQEWLERECLDCHTIQRCKLSDPDDL